MKTALVNLLDFVRCCVRCYTNPQACSEQIEQAVIANDRKHATSNARAEQLRRRLQIHDRSALPVVDPATHCSLYARAERFGIETPSCSSCQSFYDADEEMDAQYAGKRFCLMRDPDLTENAAIGDMTVCPLWLPDFWATKFADGLEPGSDVEQAMLKYKRAVASSKKASD